MNLTCELWSGEVTPNGYGHLKGLYAHRLAYEKVHGAIPPGLLVRHKCDNRLCVNPEHLELGTHLDNRNDSYERGSYAHGATVNTAKLTDETVKVIKQIPENAISCKALGEIFGVSDSAIHRIRRGTTWKHIK